MNGSFFLTFRNSIFYPFFLLFFALNVFFTIFFAKGLWGQFKIFTNVSSSMSPTIVQGDLIMTKKSSLDSYLKGDIISFYSDRFEPNGIITHRIVGAEKTLLITKGDNNTQQDAQRVNQNLIIGKVISIIPYLGYWVMSMNSASGKVLFLIIPMIVIVYSETKVIQQYSKSLY